VTNLERTSVYDEVDTETATLLRGSAEAIRRAADRILSHLFTVGHELQLTQERLSRKGGGEGIFTRWLREEFNWGEAQGYNFIHLVTRREYAPLEANLDNYPDSPLLSGLFLLGKGDRLYHQSARQEAVARLQAGEVLRYRDYKDILRRHRDGTAYLDVLDEEGPFEPTSPQAGPAWPQASVPSPDGRLLLHERSETTFSHREERTITVDRSQLPSGETVIVVPEKRDLAPHQAIHQSLSNEWYTPPVYLEAARAVLGGIDLDPASSERANRNVQAAAYYTEEDNGLAQAWWGRVFLNPPYGRWEGESSAGLWTAKLLTEYAAGRVTAAVLLVNAVPGNAWFTPLWQFPICFTDHRISFIDADGRVQAAPTHSNAFVYLGGDRTAFVSAFARFGAVVARIQA
jgi:ParB family chromosome partitioning protein